MARTSRWSGLGFLALVIATDAAPAAAQPLPTVAWDAPSSCQPRDLLARVARLTGLGPEQVGSKLTRVTARVRPQPGSGFAAQLIIQTPDGTGERAFEADDCAGLVEGTALILALTINPAVPTAAAQPPAPPLRQTRRLRYLVGPVLTFARATLPDAGLGYGLAGGLAWSHLRLAVDLTAQPAQTAAERTGRGGRLRLLLDALPRACVTAAPTGRLQPGGCLGLALGWLRSEGQNLAVRETHDDLAVEVVAGLGLGLRLYDWLWLRLEALGGVTVLRPRFLINGDEEIYRVRAVTGRGALGLELRL